MIRLSRLPVRAAALALVLFVAGLTQVKAGPAVTFDDTTTPYILVNPSFTLGWQFTTTQAIDVTALGIFDSGQDGLVDSYPIGIWNGSGTLVASAVVASGTVDPLTNQFRYAAITPVLLNPGTYNIGALFTTGDDPLFFANFIAPTNFATDALITFDQGQYVGGPTLADPTSANPGSPGYFGPDFLLTAVPEPASITLLSAGLFVFMLLRRRRVRSP